MRYDYDFEITESPYNQLYGEFLLYGILISVIFKLLRADKLAENTFHFALISPLILGIYVLLPFVIAFGLLSFIKINDSLRNFLSLLFGIATGYYFLLKDSPYGWNIFKNIKCIFFALVTANKDNETYSESHLEEIRKLDRELENELGKKYNYQLLSIFFFLITYFILNDNPAFNWFYHFINYKLNGFFKFLLLFGLLVAGLFLYSKYYDFFCEKIYKKISFLILYLEKDEKFVVIRNADGFQKCEFSIQDKNPWDRSGHTNFYYFVHTVDNELGYWIKPNLAFNHYKHVIPRLKLEGIESFLDKVIEKNENENSKDITNSN
jgi:hypothetical protein